MLRHDLLNSWMLDPHKQREWWKKGNLKLDANAPIIHAGTFTVYLGQILGKGIMEKVFFLKFYNIYTNRSSLELPLPIIFFVSGKQNVGVYKI
jgi:hypothetical protein